MSDFKALVIEKNDDAQSIALKSLSDSDLMDGDVTIRVSHSTVNYKDGLAITGRAPVVRRFPMIPGIDLAGVVKSSGHPEYKPGDSVVLNGWGLSETHFGGYSERARVKGDWLVPLPQGLPPTRQWPSAPQVTRQCSASWLSRAMGSSRRWARRW